MTHAHGPIRTKTIFTAHVAIAFTGVAISALLVMGKAFALIGCHTMSKATVGNTRGLATQDIGFTQSFCITFGTDTFAWLHADLVVSTGSIALRKAESFGAV